ncbi:M56 family metallopeptidase [Nocardioides sp. NPDC057772]|uniref:M56 family metallopeptidase n=1 Tax=unclassified Nocardioides TaxID=2615069 RepID=UPI0002028CAA|nr:M56 family metallopeptidase [Nocardioides sp. NBC_00368]EGD42850.1 integral membrane protein [Nocardioidaceae bacterium Broad-1]
MIDALLLATYAAVAGTLGAAWLRDARWTSLAPRLAIAAWQALAISVLLSLAASGLALGISFSHVSGDVARFFSLCAENLRHGYASPGGAFTALLGLTLFLALLSRTMWCAVGVSVSDRRERAARIAAFDMVGRPDAATGALIVEHDAPYAFCIGGRRHRVVLTSGLLAALRPDELDAVLAHEHAHLRQRHHTALVACRALFGTLAPVFPAFRTAMPLVRLYAELCADDGARRRVGPGPLRDALARLACNPAPAGTLAASAHDVEARLSRLRDRPRRLPVTASVGASFGIAAAVMIPLVLAAAPAIAIAWEGICRMA